MLFYQFCLVVCFLLAQANAADDLHAKAWQSKSGFPQASDFPENSLLAHKPNTAIGFTGGGSRAYIAALGYLAGLRDLDLVKNVRYIGGISGGSWATTTYTYAQNSTGDKEFLGAIVPPEQIVQKELQEMSNTNARRLTNVPMTLIALNALKEGTVKCVADAWAYAVSKTYLEPVGITPNTRFSWDANTVKDIKARNPQLKDAKFQLPANGERPFPILGTTLVGPADGAPYKPDTQNYTMLDMTPLYVGQFRTLDVSYKYSHGLKHKKRVGGAVESFAFAHQGSSPTIGLASRESAVLKVPAPEVIFDLQFAAAASSYAPGSLFESLTPEQLANGLALKFDYWSPTEAIPSAETTLFADGGCYENIPVINFLQRKVDKVVLFYSSHTPLAPAQDYNPATDEFTGKQISDDLAAFFGVYAKMANWENRSFEIENNQVFSKADYVTMVTTLQAAQAKGNGIISSFNFTTVENQWWGIPAGQKVELVVAYLGRLSSWEAKLSKEMHALAVPEKDAEDLSVDINHGPFKNFPHYATLGGEINFERANLLADLTGWSLLQHADLFRRILS